MEQQHPDPLFGLQVDLESGEHLKETAKWTKFISITYIIGFAIGAIGLLFAGAIFFFWQDMDGEMTRLLQLEERRSSLGIQLSIAFLGVCLLLPGGIQLLRFTNLCRRGIIQQDQASFNAGLRSMRNYLIFYSIIAILSVVGSLLQIAVAL